MTDIRAALEQLVAATTAFRNPPKSEQFRVVVALDDALARAEKTLELVRLDVADSAATCPGPNGRGCDCNANGADPHCPWQVDETTAASEGVVPYTPRPGTPSAILVDLDGTLCLHNGRDPYDESLVEDDVPNQAVLATITGMRALGMFLIFCSGRTEGCRGATWRWIRRYVGMPLGPLDKPLFMREIGDTRKDTVVKRELFDAHIRDEYDVLYVLDDRQQVVDGWRELGLTVFQVAPGNF